MVKQISPIQKTLNLWAVVLIVWSIYRAYFKTDLPIWFDEFIAKPLVFILPVYFYITKLENKNFFSNIDLRLAKIVPNILLGVLIGLFFFISGGAGILIKSKSLDVFFKNLPSYQSLMFFVAVAIATSISEEILSRGFVLKRLFKESGNVITSSLLASFLFFFLHLPILLTNEQIIGTVLFRVMFTDLILSFAVSIIYLQRKSLILPILIHAFYSLSYYIFM